MRLVNIIIFINIGVPPYRLYGRYDSQGRILAGDSAPLRVHYAATIHPPASVRCTVRSDQAEQQGLATGPANILFIVLLREAADSIV